MQDILVPILRLSNFDVFKTDYLYFLLFGFGHTESFDQIFEDAGFEGFNFIVGIGPIFIGLVLYFTWILLQSLIRAIIVKANIK